MKKKINIIIFLLLVTCSPNTEESQIQSTPTTISTTSTITTSTTTSSTIPDNPLIVKSFEQLPEALVRIEVKSTRAELTDELNIEIFEYEGSGSGFFISDDGYIVTNNHVVSGAVTIEVYTQYRSQPYTAKLIGLSECDDLAVLKIDIKDSKYLVFNNSEPKLGQEIIAAGFPLGDEEVTFLNGIVSKKQTNGSTSWASIEYAFEHTAEILPGSSGGPIVNESVEVVGIAYSGNEDRQEFGIPIVLVVDKIEKIIQNDFEYSFNVNLEQFYGGGIYVYSVDSNSPLRSVGLKGGELITEIKGLSLIDEITLKIYCDAIYARNPNIGIKFSGISLEDLEEFEVEVSLDGTVSNEISRKSIFTNSSNSNQSSPETTTAPASSETYKSPKYIYEVPEIIKLDSFKISEYEWEIKIYLNYIQDSTGVDDGFETISHCVVGLFAPPYFDNKDSIDFKGGQVKRQENCSSERINETNIVITHNFNLNNHSFLWENLEYSEIPIYSITLYPNYDLKNEDTYSFAAYYLFGSGRACGYHEPGTKDGKNYSKDCDEILNDPNHLMGMRQISNTNYRFTIDSGQYKWTSDQEYFTLVDSNNFCSSSYRSYGWAHVWSLDSNSVCIKR